MTSYFVDTHCHFDFPPFVDDEAAELARANSAGVEKIIAVSISEVQFARVMILARTHPQIYAALGMHPIAIAKKHGEKEIAMLEHWLKRLPEKLVAIGEIGLDLFIDTPKFEHQQALLDAQLRLARDYDLPVILHSRRTHDKLAQHLRRIALPRRGVVHAFTGSEQQAQVFIRAGYAIGVGGTITYKRASKTRNAIARLPLSSLLLETDSPYMPLYGYQNQLNRPERICEVWKALCQLRSEPPEHIAETLRANTYSLFSL